MVFSSEETIERLYSCQDSEQLGHTLIKHVTDRDLHSDGVAAEELVC